MIKNKTQPKNWRKVKLGEVATVKTGGTPSRQNPDYYKNGKILWVKTQELLDGPISNTGEKITEDAVKKSNAKIFPMNSVVLAMYGATVGKLGILKKESSTNQACAVILCNDNLCNYNFLFYFLLNNRRSIMSSASGAAQQNLNLDIVKKFELNLPNISTQKLIADILSAFDDKIELNNKINQNLEQTAQTIFKEWFVKFKFPGHEKVKMVDSELGKIPEGWEIKKFEDVMEFLNGEYIPNSEYSPNGKYTIYGSNSIMGQADRFSHEGPVVIIAKIGSYCGAIRYSQVPCWINNNAGGIKGGKGVPTSFAYYLLRRFNFNQVKEGSGQPFINMKGLKGQKTMFPSSKLLNLFSDNIDKIRIHISNIQKENQKLAVLRDLLLPKLMSGEINVL